MIDVIVPTYNEEESIASFLKVLKKELGAGFRVILVDDSTDNTLPIAVNAFKKLKIKNTIIKRKNTNGKGSAVNAGFKALKSDFGVLIDADLEYHPKYIKPMLKRLKDYDLVTSTRLRKDPWHRRVLGTIFKKYVKLLFNIGFETQSGLKVFKTEAVKEVNLESRGWVFDVELIYKLLNNKKKVSTHNIVYNARKTGRSKINLLTPLIMFYELIVLRLRL